MCDRLGPKNSFAYRNNARIKKTKWSESQVFSKDGVVPGATVKAFFAKLMIRKGTYFCVFCGINRWNDRFLVLHMDHIDGDRQNNERTNLRLLCPNCHSQTENYCGANSKTCTVRGKQVRQFEQYMKNFGSTEL